MRGRFFVQTGYNKPNGEPLLIEMGHIQSLSDAFTPQIATFQGIPSQPSENAFIMDTGVKREISITFIRVCPREPIDDLYGDSSLWSNGFWLTIVNKLIVNRWQAETDGVKVTYIQSEDGRDTFPDIPLTNSYVKSWTTRYTKGNVQTLVGNATFIVGSTKMSHAISPTVVYHANYSEYLGTTATDSSNLVKSYESTEGVPVLSYPPDWSSYLIGKYGKAPSPDRVWFCPNTMDTLSQAKEKGIAYLNNAHIGNQTGFENTVNFKGLTSTVLYARYMDRL